MLGCEKIREQSNGWVCATCPFATWTHAGGSDSTPSFAVKVSGGQSGYRCLSCGKGGPLSRMPWALSAVSGGAVRMAPLFEFLRTRNVSTMEEIRDRARTEYVPKVRRPPPLVGSTKVQEFTIPERDPNGREAEPVVTIPEADMHRFEKLPPEILAMKVCAKRIITPRSYEDWQIRWHEPSKRIAIPLRDHEGRLIAISGRIADDDHCPRHGTAYEIRVEPPKQPGGKEKRRRWCDECDHEATPKYLHTVGFKRNNYLYGEHRIARGRAGILVEGQFDTVSLHQRRYNGFGIMGTYLAPEQIRKVREWFTSIVILREWDKAGVQLAKNVEASLQGIMPVSVKALPDHVDADEIDDNSLCDILGPPNLDPR